MNDKIKNDVLFGKEGWLFLFQGAQKQFDYLTGVKKIDKQNIDNFTENIISRKAFCDLNEIKYMHIVFPSKPLLKTKYLPDDYKNVDSLFNKYFAKKIDNATDGKSSTYLFYLLEFLKSIESNYSTYKKLDTHMTDRANFDTCNYLLGKCNVKTTKDSTVNTTSESGDLCNMTSQFEVSDEEYISNNAQHIYEVGNVYALRSLTNEVYITHNEFATSKNRLLIFGTSSIRQFITHLRHNFIDILYIRSSFMHYDIINLYKPDVIFTTSAERYLSHIDSDKEANNFLLDLYGKENYKPATEYLNAFRAQLSFNDAFHRYEGWKKRVEKLVFSKFDNYQINWDIEQYDKNKLKFKSIGNDPFIIYKNINFKIGVKYIFSCKFISSVNSIFKIYYSDFRFPKHPFHRDNLFAIKTHTGLNSISVVLDFKYMSDELRIDPMEEIGEFEIISLDLVELNQCK